jgi:transcriptional regulator with XRE-family HTH domain
VRSSVYAHDSPLSVALATAGDERPQLVRSSWPGLHGQTFDIPGAADFCAGASLAPLTGMPRRNEPDDLALQVGQRIRELREDNGMTIQQLAETSEIGSKGHISNMERGLVRPNIQTLKQVADGLGVLPLDLMTFPKLDLRQKLIDLTRYVSRMKIGEVIRVLSKHAKKK